MPDIFFPPLLILPCFSKIQASVTIVVIAKYTCLKVFFAVCAQCSSFEYFLETSHLWLNDLKALQLPWGLGLRLDDNCNLELSHGIICNYQCLLRFLRNFTHLMLMKLEEENFLIS